MLYVCSLFISLTRERAWDKQQSLELKTVRHILTFLMGSQWPQGITTGLLRIKVKTPLLRASQLPLNKLLVSSLALKTPNSLGRQHCWGLQWCDGGVTSTLERLNDLFMPIQTKRRAEDKIFLISRKLTTSLYLLQILPNPLPLLNPVNVLDIVGHFSSSYSHYLLPKSH